MNGENGMRLKKPLAEARTTRRTIMGNKGRITASRSSPMTTLPCAALDRPARAPDRVFLAWEYRPAAHRIPAVLACLAAIAGWAPDVPRPPMPAWVAHLRRAGLARGATLAADMDRRLQAMFCPAAQPAPPPTRQATLHTLPTRLRKLRWSMRIRALAKRAQ